LSITILNNKAGKKPPILRTSVPRPAWHILSRIRQHPQFYSSAAIEGIGANRAIVFALDFTNPPRQLV
jgi:hypothetical protein